MLPYPTGFAGGINPENVQAAHQQIKELGIARYWLDLESGVRLENEFSMAKAYDICEKVFS